MISIWLESKAVYLLSLKTTVAIRILLDPGLLEVVTVVLLLKHRTTAATRALVPMDLLKPQASNRFHLAKAVAMMPAIAVVLAVVTAVATAANTATT